MKENKLTIFINSPVKEVFDYSLESNNVPKWITSIKEEIPEERPVKLGIKLRNIGVDSEQWNTYEMIEFEPPKTFTLKRLNGDYFVKYTCTEKNNGTDFEYFEWAEKENLDDLMEIKGKIKLENMLEDLKYYGEEGAIIKSKVNSPSDVWIEYDKKIYNGDKIFESLINDIQRASN